MWDFANKSQQQSEVESLGSKKGFIRMAVLSVASCGAGGGQTEARRAPRGAGTSVSVTANEEDCLTGPAADAPAHSHTALHPYIFNSLSSFV